MSNEDTIDDSLTRRAYLTYGGAAAAGGLLAGCTGGDAESPTTGTATETSSASAAATETPTAEDEPYSVTMEPVGTVEFESVPESVATFTPDYIEMLVALGHGDAAESVWYQNRYKTMHYGELDGVSIDTSGLVSMWNDGISKELFYEIDADFHLIDPHSLTDWMDDWSQADVDEIRRNVAPFLGNLIFRRTDDWHEYRYYTLFEAFEKVAAAFRERERYEAIRSIHQSVVADVESRLPAPEDRPNAVLVFAGDEPEDFAPYRVSGTGANKEHFRTLGLSDAFEGTGIEGYSGSQSVDYETLLEIDPDALLLRYHGNKTREEFEDTTVSYVRDHDLGSELSAVQNDMVFRGSPIYCGPLHNLFMIERYATGLYPEEFTEDQLFDRDRLATIITEGVEE